VPARARNRGFAPEGPASDPDSLDYRLMVRELSSQDAFREILGRRERARRARRSLRGAALAATAMAFGAPALWAHPGHVTEDGLWHTVRHLVTSPYHVAVIVGVVALGVAWTVALRSRRQQRLEREAELPAKD